MFVLWFLAEVVKLLLQYVMVYSVHAQKFVVLKRYKSCSHIDKMSKLLVISISRFPLPPKWRNLQKALLSMFTHHSFAIFLAFIPRDWKQVKQVDCNTCLSHVICMLFLAVIISTVLYGVLKTRTYIMIETNLIFHVFMCVTQSVFMPILYLTPSTVLLFAQLQSCSYCLAFFSSEVLSTSCHFIHIWNVHTPVKLFLFFFF